MRSVRLRLLFLALAPLGLLMPLMLLLGVARWTRDYDRVLIANVESDLRIAEQYLSRIQTSTGNELLAVANSVEFADVLRGGEAAQARYFAQKRAALGLDFLYFLPRGAAEGPAARWPIIASGLGGAARTGIDIFDAEALAALPGGLAAKARIDLVETEAARPTERRAETRGMVVHSASPVRLGAREGVLVGGILLNRNLDFIDEINALVYLGAITGGDRQGTATLFLEDVRISTNVRLFEDVRALGTRVSEAVRSKVLDEGQTWLDRAFVVNDWYISGYLPLKDSFGAHVGMLYVGFLEAPFSAAKRAAVIWMMIAFAGVLLLSVPLFLWLAKGIFSPLERMIETMRRVGRGDLSARIAHGGGADEIGQVAGHLDDLLDQVQDRDKRLRDWAGELNRRVEARTGELERANAKLEQTYRQLALSEKLASIGEITAGVAHEINNPLAVIQGNMDVIRDVLGRAGTGPIRTEVDLIDAQVARIQAIVGKLLSFAQPGSGAGGAQEVALGALIDECLVLVEHVLARGRIEVIQTRGPAPLVWAEPGELQQVVINLIVNAAQAMGDGGRIFIALSAEPREGRAGAAMSLRDTGPGIAPDKIGAVFDPFFTTKIGEGTGLGLSISQALIQRAGGIIRAENAPEGGAVFHVWLPAAQSPKPE